MSIIITKIRFRISQSTSVGICLGAIPCRQKGEHVFQTEICALKYVICIWSFRITLDNFDCYHSKKRKVGTGDERTCGIHVYRLFVGLVSIYAFFLYYESSLSWYVHNQNKEVRSCFITKTILLGIAISIINLLRDQCILNRNILYW